MPGRFRPGVTSVLLPCYKSEKLLEKTALPMYRHIANRDVEMIFYDNGGNGETLSKEPERPSFRFIGDGVNIGLNAALNACFQEAAGEYLYLPHTDMIPDLDTIPRLVKQAKKFAPASYLFCSRSIEPVQGHTPFHLIENHGDENDLNWVSLAHSFIKHGADNSIVTGYRMPFFMHRKLWEKMDGVDDQYFSYATDNDLFMTAYHVGVRRFWMINNSLVYHMQGKSNAQQTVDKDNNKPYELFAEKWAKRGYNTNLHIDELERSLVPWNNRVN